MLIEALCRACGIAFDEAMLSWPKGPKSFDGVWAPHWYNAVWESTGFAKPEAPDRAACPIIWRASPMRRGPSTKRLRAFRIT